LDYLDRWQIVKLYLKPSMVRSISEIVITLSLMMAAYIGLYICVHYSVGLTLLLSIPAGLLLVRVFIIQHDAGHGTFFANPKWNHAIGLFCSLFTLTPYFFWRKAHAIHHKNSSDLSKRGVGDIDFKTIAEYESLSKWQKVKYRLMRNPIILIGIGGPVYFLLQNRYFNYDRQFRTQFNPASIQNIYLTNIACLILYALVIYFLGTLFFLCAVVPVFWISSSVGVYLFYIQHNFDGVYYAYEPELDRSAVFRGSSFLNLPAVLRWVTGSIGYHHMHHFCPKIPFYNLKVSYEKLCHSFSIEDIVAKYSFLSSLRLFSLHLYDEKQKRMIGWKEYKIVNFNRGIYTPNT
jgi:omega-6 fatty acid desaturase (delta-12 desaturase)